MQFHMFILVDKLTAITSNNPTISTIPAHKNKSILLDKKQNFISNYPANTL